MVAGVIVDVAVWGLDRELTYLVPGKMADRIRVGSIVRVPLRNRRVRGWVTSLDPDEGREPGPGQADDLAWIGALSGRGPVFDETLLGAAKTLARRYVHPVCSFLSLFTPDRLGRPPARWPKGSFTARPSSQKLVRLGVTENPVETYSEMIAAELDGGGGVIVAVPEVREGSRVLAGLSRAFESQAAEVHSGINPAERSAGLWQVAEGKKRLVLGGRASAFAPAFNCGLVIVHQEHDRSFKDQRSPYYDARIVAQVRARETGCELLLTSSTPSAESVWRFPMQDSPVQGERSRQRAEWPVVEIVEPGKTVIARRAVAAIIEARSKGERTLVLLPRSQPTRPGPAPSR